MTEQFFSFEEALHELRLKEEELRRLVSEGEIRAFRDGDTMKLRRSDVETLRSELSGGEVVDLDSIGEELVFEDDTDLDAGMATEEISEADTLLEDDVEDVGELEIEEIGDDDEDEDEVAPVAAAPLRRSALAVEPVEEAAEPMFVRAVAILTGLVLIMAFPVCISASTGNVMGLASSIAGMFGLEINP